jgi:hypothetical protein
MPDAIEDLVNWPSNGLAVVSCWNTGGYSADWHADQVRTRPTPDDKIGNRFLPSFKLNPLGSQSPKSLGPKLRPENEAFLRDNRIPLSLRSDNVASNVTTLDRLPIALESIPNSPVIWTIKDGVLNDGAVADCFGPTKVWLDAGLKWAEKSGFILDLQKRFPDAAFVLLGDNNESNVDSIGRYVAGNSWKPNLETLSLRVHDYAATHTPADFALEFADRRDWQYKQHFAGFNIGLTEWIGRLLTEAYKIGTVQPAYTDQFGHYDGGGSPLYVSGAGNGTTGDFTSSDWFKVYYSSPINLQAEADNPRHFREWFIQFFPGTAFDGYRLGRHEVITPDHIEAWAQWLLWSTRGNGRGINLRYFTETGQKPKNPFLDTDLSRQIVTDAGHPELVDLKEEDYIKPLMRAVTRIAENETLRRFFQHGNAVQTGTHPANEIRAFTTTPATVFPPAGQPDDGFRLLDCDVNTPRSQWVRPPGPNSRGAFNPISIKVWATATELDGEYEINIWCPCPRPLSCNITLPNGWKFPVTITEPGMDFVLKPKAGFDVEVVQ